MLISSNFKKCQPSLRRLTKPFLQPSALAFDPNGRRGVVGMASPVRWPGRKEVSQGRRFAAGVACLALNFWSFLRPHWSVKKMYIKIKLSDTKMRAGFTGGIHAQSQV